MGTTSPHRDSPVMTTKEAAAYVRRSPNAMKILRHRRKGPDSFERDGRILYYVAELDRWLAAGAATDSRSNRDLDPTAHVPRPRRSQAKTPRRAPAAA